MSERPSEIRLREQGRLLELGYGSEKKLSLSAEYLRVESPSAEVQGHSKDEAIVVGGKRNVRIKNLEPVGNYAIRIIFDDGHSTGLYTWSYLADLSANEHVKWASYLLKVQELGLSRD